jgi:hypothetical protein
VQHQDGRGTGVDVIGYNPLTGQAYAVHGGVEIFDVHMTNNLCWGFDRINIGNLVRNYLIAIMNKKTGPGKCRTLFDDV